MQLFANTKAGSERSSAGFTMVEIALSLAVVAFALVAIIGVLPTGMTVQKENREDTLINQEGRYWMEAIKSGARGLDELTNHVEFISLLPSEGRELTLSNSPAQPLKAVDIIAVLSTPKVYNEITNRITARVRAITGVASDQGALTNDVGFRYQLQTELVPVYPYPPEYVGDVFQNTQDPALLRFNESMRANLWDVRLILRWPVVERGNGFFVGNNRKTFRARISGRPVAVTNLSNFIERRDLVVFSPNNFDVQAGLQP